MLGKTCDGGILPDGDGKEGMTGNEASFDVVFEETINRVRQCLAENRRASR